MRDYDNPLVRAAVEQRAAFLRSKADRLYSHRDCSGW